jgi:hypothetical protein
MNRFTELLAVFESDASNRSLDISGKRRDVVIDALRIAAASILPPIPNASDIEKKIVGRLVTDILATGVTVSIYDGEEFALEDSNDEAAIYAALSSTDTDRIYIHDLSRKRVGWILLVWGNDVDIISDYTTNLSPKLTAGANALADELDR